MDNAWHVFTVVPQVSTHMLSCWNTGYYLKKWIDEWLYAWGQTSSLIGKTTNCVLETLFNLSILWSKAKNSSRHEPVKPLLKLQNWDVYKTHDESNTTNEKLIIIIAIRGKFRAEQ